MSFLPLAVTSPWILAALALLPAIWWLLRLTPPRPQQEIFPPLRILERVLKREEMPSKSPWWLTLLRIILVALVIFALSQPILNPRQSLITGEGPMAIVVDNGWATQTDWETRISAVQDMLEHARNDERPVSMVFTADQSHDGALKTAAEQLERLAAAKVEPLRTDRLQAAKALAFALQNERLGTLVLVGDGLASETDTEAFAALAEVAREQSVVLQPNSAQTVSISNSTNAQDSLKVTLSRLQTSEPLTFTIDALDAKSRPLASGRATFASGSSSSEVTLSAPLELRNDINRLTVREIRTAGATRLLDEGSQRRRVAILASDSGDETNSLLRQANYIQKAIQPYADIIQLPQQSIALNIRDALAENPSIIFMTDIGRIPPESEIELDDWIDAGGTLVRFAGRRLASSDGEDDLLPVQLRKGERAFGGAMTWAEPQKMAEFSPSSPFATLTIDPSITIKRQLLAEPSPDLSDRTWASLVDGTPLVTAKDFGLGRIILFHVSAEPDWSDLPLSGQFVEMLRTITQNASTLSRGRDGEASASLLAPYRMLTSVGALTADVGAAKSFELTAGAPLTASKTNPPGFYGTDEGYVALNLFNGEELQPIDLKPLGNDVTTLTLTESESIPLMPILLLLALALLVADSIIMLVLNGGMSTLRLKRASSSAAVLIFAALALNISFSDTRAADEKPGDEALIAALEQTRMAYVLTGEADVDQLSQQGLRGLGDFIRYRTTFDAGEPQGVDLNQDELSFYPIIYWPISATAPMPSQEAISRIDAYMRSGGTVLFDTRDQDMSLTGSTGTSPNSIRLQEILANIDIPPLEQTPENHVLTRSFYLLNEFPGRFSGGALWIESRQDASRSVNAVTSAGDGVSPILITSNDFAGAWAIDESGAPVLPTASNDQMQRNYAYRAGLNIMMYMLTGNYKADQVHVPALLERLGQ